MDANELDVHSVYINNCFNLSGKLQDDVNISLDMLTERYKQLELYVIM